MNDITDKIFLPGDKLDEKNIYDDSVTNIKIGPGLMSVAGNLITCKPGILKQGRKNQLWIESAHKRYAPVHGDNVLGVVLTRGGETYKVDLGASDLALLPWLAFEGATKRNKPDVEVGDIIYGRVVLPNKDMEPELSCTEEAVPKQGYGVIHTDGYLFQCSLNLARRLLQQSCPFRKEISHYMHGEVIVGINGRIWVKGRSVEETLILVNVIRKIEYLSDEQISFVIKQQTENVKLFPETRMECE